MKFKPIKNLIRIFCAIIISISLALPVSSTKPETPNQAIVAQIKNNNNLSKSIINQIYTLLNSSDSIKNLTQAELFSAKSSLSELKSLFENLSVSQMGHAQEIFKKLNVLHKYVSNRSSPPNIIELTKNISETSKYIKNLPRNQSSSNSIQKNAQEILKKIKELKIPDQLLSKFQEFTSYLDKTLNSNFEPEDLTSKKIGRLNLFFINILHADSQTTKYYVLNKLPQKIDEFMGDLTNHQELPGEKSKNPPQKILPKQTSKNVNIAAKNPIIHLTKSKNIENEPLQSQTPLSPKQYQTFLESQARKASQIEVLADGGLKETWEKHIQAGIQGTNDCWLFSAINVKNWFNFKNNQKIIRGQTQAHEEFLNKGEPKGLLGRSQNQIVIAKYLQKCGFNCYIILSCLEKMDNENLKFNKSLAEILVKTHFLKSQSPIIVHKENHWFVIAAINTAKNQGLIVDSAFSKPFWKPLPDFYDIISGTSCFFKSKHCYALGMIFTTSNEPKLDKPKSISLVQSNVNSSKTNDIFNVNQFLSNAIDAASK